MTLLQSAFLIALIVLMAGCAAPSQVTLNTSGIENDQLVTLYVPQKFVTHVNGQPLESGFDLSGGKHIEIIEMPAGQKHFEGWMFSSFQPYGPKYLNEKIDVTFSSALMPGHVYFIYLEFYDNEVEIHGRDLGKIRNDFDPVLNPFGIVEEGRAERLRKHEAYYLSLRFKGQTMEIVSQ